LAQNRLDAINDRSSPRAAFVRRYAPTDKPETLAEDIEAALG
jgi:hypothetical protein